VSIDVNLDRSSDFTLELSTTSALAEILNTPVSLSIYLLIKYQEYEQISEKALNPIDYEDWSLFRDDYLIVSVLKKSQNLPLNVDKRQAALETYLESEKGCAETNERIREGQLNGLTGKLRFFISSVLGPLNSQALNDIQNLFKFGPGATTCIKAEGSVVSDKYDADISLSIELYPFYKSILGDRWWKHQPRPKIVEGNKFGTVPKNAKTDRGICKEPTLNTYVQGGIGKYLRRRLRERTGINLLQQDRNQKFAALAYKRGLATIDLSAASDSISYELVKAVLPWEWFTLLCTSRCDRTLVGKTYHENEKFSSMGNGYTFELESLIFSAVCFQIVPIEEWHNVTVYGDDIIVPAQYAHKLVETLNLLGFKVNREKSFLAGNFFESCGTDWFKAMPVRPFYLKRDHEKDPTESIPYALQIANALRLYSNRIDLGESCDIRFKPLWRALVKATPSSWRKNKIPASLGDAGIIVGDLEINAVKRRSRVKRVKQGNTKALGGLEGYEVRHTALTPLKVRKHSFGRMLYALASQQSKPFDPFASTCSKQSSRGFEARRGIFGLPAQTVSIVSHWTQGFRWRSATTSPVRSSYCGVGSCN